MVKVIIFDYYGVIANDAFWYRVKGLEAGKHKSKYIQKLSDEVNVDKISWQEYCEAVAKDVNETVEVVMERYANHKIQPGIVDLIKSVATNYRVALFSNASAEQLLPVMKHLGLDRLFEKVFVSSDLKLMKPDPEAFHAVVKKLGVEMSECLMIDDSRRNIDSAMSVGMQGIVFEDSEDCSAKLQALLKTA